MRVTWERSVGFVGSMVFHPYPFVHGGRSRLSSHEGQPFHVPPVPKYVQARAAVIFEGGHTLSTSGARIFRAIPAQEPQTTGGSMKVEGAQKERGTAGLTKG